MGQVGLRAGICDASGGRISGTEQMVREAGLGLPVTLFCLRSGIIWLKEVLCLRATGAGPKATVQTPRPLEEEFGCLCFRATGSSKQAHPKPLALREASGGQQRLEDFSLQGLVLKVLPLAFFFFF